MHASPSDKRLCLNMNAVLPTLPTNPREDQQEQQEKLQEEALPRHQLQPATTAIPRRNELPRLLDNLPPTTTQIVSVNRPAPLSIWGLVVFSINDKDISIVPKSFDLSQFWTGAKGAVKTGHLLLYLRKVDEKYAVM